MPARAGAGTRGGRRRPRRMRRGRWRTGRGRAQETLQMSGSAHRADRWHRHVCRGAASQPRWSDPATISRTAVPSPDASPSTRDVRPVLSGDAESPVHLRVPGSRDCSGPDGQSHEELLVSARPGVCGVTGTYGARVPSVHGRGLITVIFRLPSIDRRASEPGRRSNRTEGTPAEPSEWQALPTSPGRPAPSHVTAGQPPLLCTTTASMCPCRRTGWPRFLGPRPRLLTSSGRIDIRDDAANHPHHSTHRGLLVIDGPCPPANDDRSPSR
jgi:hypothetical protein